MPTSVRIALVIFAIFGIVIAIYKFDLLTIPNSLDHNYENNNFEIDKTASFSENLVRRIIQTDSRFVVVNEDHENDFHREYSAYLLNEIAQYHSVIMGLEALGGQHDIHQASDISFNRGYMNSSGFRTMIRVAEEHDIPVFGYDTPRDEKLSTEQLETLGLSRVMPNSRDRPAAETLIDTAQAYPDHLVYLHVGFAHASEAIGQSEHGLHAWLAGHIKLMTGQNPVTVYQMRPDSFEYYELRNLVVWDINVCSSMDRVSWLIHSQSNFQGCIHQDDLQSTHQTDFIVIHH